MEKFYTVYKITNIINNKFYIGSHMTTNIDDKYMGSSKHLRKDIKELGKENFKKEILHIFETKEEMITKEAELVTKEFCYRNDTYNRMVGGITGSFNFEGMTTVKDSEGNTLKVYLDDPRYKSGELISIFTGTIPVKDKNGNCFRIDKNDERYLSGELVFEKTGMVSVKDKNGNTSSVDKNDERIKTGELFHVCSGQVTVKDKNGNTFSVKKNDPKYLSGELIHNMTDMILVKDKDENRSVVHREDKKYLSGELVSVHKGRVGIKSMLGKKIREDVKEVLREKAKLRVGDKSSTYGTVYINNNIEDKRIKKEELDDWLNKGWKWGKKSDLTNDQINLLILDYQIGLSQKELYDKYNIHDKLFRRILKDNSVEKRPNITKKIINELTKNNIIKDYLDKMTIKNIMTKNNIKDTDIIYQILKENNIKLKSNNQKGE